MSLKEATYYYVECDTADCGARTGDMGDFSAWSDHGAALDDWVSSDGYHDEKTGQTFCGEHRPKLCVECDARATGVDAEGDDACDEHSITPPAPAPPVQTPVPQAVTVAVEHSAATVTRTDDRCICGHAQTEHNNGHQYCNGWTDRPGYELSTTPCGCAWFVLGGGAASIALVFMDTETTGLALTDEVWEFAAIRREPDGTQAEHHMFIDHNPALCALLPGSFKADHQARWQPEASLNRREAARRISSIFADRPHVVGAVPNFDTERLARLLKRAGVGPGWHYHLIDVENLAVGYLAAKGIPVALPWDSDALSRACGVEPPTTERHTAMGDARWAMALYDAILSDAA